jgi:hypothetical protein
LERSLNESETPSEHQTPSEGAEPLALAVIPPGSDTPPTKKKPRGKAFGIVTSDEPGSNYEMGKARPGLINATIKGKRKGLTGPAPDSAKIMRAELEDMGVREDRMPKQLKDKIVAKSRPGPLGQIQMRYLSGMAANTAKRAVDQFEENTGGREDIIEKLMAAKEGLSAGEQNLLLMLQDPALGRRTLARLVAESGAEPTALMKGYAKGAMLLGKMKAAIWAHNALPRLVKDLIGHAIDSDVLCHTCVGLGKIASKPRGGALNKVMMADKITCPSCSGSGQEKHASKFKQFAAEKLLEIGEMVGKTGPLVQFNQQINTPAPGGGLSEKILNAAEAILRRPNNSDVIDVEATTVPSNDRSSESS